MLLLDERSVETVSTQFNIFKNKANVESMLNESLNQFKIDSTHFQQAFHIIFKSSFPQISTEINFWWHKSKNRFSSYFAHR